MPPNYASNPSQIAKLDISVHTKDSQLLQDGIDMTDKTEHLHMIQSVISRMANNSLQIKCWSVAIVSASIVLSRSVIIIACLLPLMLFCLLDVKYLSLERSYRKLYDEVRMKDESEIDFSMEYEKIPKKESFKSWSVWMFYPLLALLLIAVAVFNLCW